MKKAMKILYILCTIAAVIMLIIGVARIASAEDVIGRVPLTYATCDYNKDGQVNSDDAIYLLMYTQFYDKYPGEYEVFGKVDLNNDENVNSDDAIYLLMYTQFPDIYPIEPNNSNK